MIDEIKNRPHTTVILAMSADGKIADVLRSPARFSSWADKAHLEQQIAVADAVLFGAGTLRAYGTTLRVSHPQLLQQRKQSSLPPQPVQIVVSLQANIAPQLQFFRQPVPRWLLTTSIGASHWEGRQEFERIIVCQESGGTEQGEYFSRGAEEQRSGGAERCAGEQRSRGSTVEKKYSLPPSPLPPIPSASHPLCPPSPLPPIESAPQPPAPGIDWTDALQQLANLRVKRLAVLGGGQLVASMLFAGVIDEFWLTVCPLILGGASSPTPVEGMGFDPALAPRLELISVQAKEGEVFLHYRLQRP